MPSVIAFWLWVLSVFIVIAFTVILFLRQNIIDQEKEIIKLKSDVEQLGIKLRNLKFAFNELERSERIERLLKN